MKHFITFLIFVFSFSSSYSQIPQLISWQGIVQDASGNNLNGSYDLTFKIYDSETDGELIWSETHTDFNIDNGLVNIKLGSIISLPNDFGRVLYLELTIASNPPLPRQLITPSPSSIYSEDFSGKLKNRNLTVTRNNEKRGFNFDSENLRFEIKDNDTVWYGIYANFGMPAIIQRHDDSTLMMYNGEGKALYNTNTENPIYQYEISRGISGTYYESSTNTNPQNGKVLMSSDRGMYIAPDSSVVEQKFFNYKKDGNNNYYIEKFDINGFIQKQTYFKYDPDGNLKKIHEVEYSHGVRIKETFWDNNTFNKSYSYELIPSANGSFTKDEFFFNPANGHVLMFKTHSFTNDTQILENEIEEFWNNNVRKNLIQRSKVDGKLTNEVYYTYNELGEQKKTRELSYENGIKYEETMFGTDGFPVKSPKIIFDPFVMNGQTDIFGPGKIRLFADEHIRLYNPTTGASLYSIMGENTETSPAVTLDVAHGINQSSLIKALFASGELQTTILGTVKLPGILSVSNTANFFGDVSVGGNTFIGGNANFNGNLNAVNGIATFKEIITADFTATKKALFEDGLTSHGSNTFTGSMQVYSGANFGGDVNVGGSLNPTSLDVYLGMKAAHGLFYDSLKVNGDVKINGDLNVLGEKNFRIDHPDDPYNKFLFHASIESDDVLNQYSGNIITDFEGKAVVTLPDYVEKINTDFRYQLTVIGDFAQAIIYKEISSNQFVIKTDKPNIKVSWLVTGKRNDDVMRSKPFQAIREKSGDEKGKLLLGTKNQR